MSNRPASPSYLDASAQGCRGRQEAYENREPEAPDGLREYGTTFHQMAYGVQALRLASDIATDAAMQSVIEEAHATDELASALRMWGMSGWADVSDVVGVEMGLSIDADGDLLECLGAPVTFRRRDSWLRGVIDRLENRYDEDARAQLLCVTDWKAWGSWKRLQAESYALLAFSYAEAKGLDIDGVQVQTWHYRPTTSPATTFWLDDRESLREQVGEAIAAAERLRRAPSTHLRPGEGCAHCPRLLGCDAVREAVNSPLPLVVQSQEQAMGLAARLEAAEAIAIEIRKRLKPWASQHGMVPTTGRAWGPHARPSTSVVHREVAGAIVDHVAPLLGEGADLDGLERRLAQLVRLGTTSVKALVGQITKDREERADLMASLTREGSKRVVGWEKGE